MNLASWLTALLRGTRADARRRADAYEQELMVQLSGFIDLRHAIGDTVKTTLGVRDVQASGNEIRLK